MFYMTSTILRNNPYAFKGLMPNIGLFPAFTQVYTAQAQPVELIMSLKPALYLDTLFYMFC